MFLKMNVIGLFMNVKTGQFNTRHIRANSVQEAVECVTGYPAMEIGGNKDMRILLTDMKGKVKQSMLKQRLVVVSGERGQPGRWFLFDRIVRGTRLC